MKLFKRIILVFTTAIAAACTSGSDDPVHFKINHTSQFLIFDATAQSGEISISSTGPWVLVPDKSATWCKVDTTSGEAGDFRIGFSIEENAEKSRTAILTFLAGGKNYRFAIIQRTREKLEFDDADCYFYITFGTLPTLYAGLHLLSHDKPSFVFYQRSRTFNPEKFPSNAEVSIAADPSEDATDNDMERMRTAMKQRIVAINAENPKTVFGLCVDDLRCRIGYDWFVAQGIDSARVKVTMLSDGTGTYNNFYTYFGDPATAEQNWNTYAGQVEALDWSNGSAAPETRIPEGFDSYEWPYYLATRPNYRLVLQNAGLLETSSPFMDDRLAEMRTESQQPADMLRKLTEEKRQTLFQMAECDIDYYARLFDKSPKKNLIVIGTSHSSAEGAEQQVAYVERIMNEYGPQYDIFFKPHPADTSSGNYEERFEGLTLLPGYMPFEVFVWGLIDRIDLIGGYASTVFITIPVEKTGFLFAPSAEALPRPLNILFRNAPHVSWIQLPPPVDPEEPEAPEVG